MLRLILILILISSPISSFSQIKKNEPISEKTLWQKNGIVINNSLGRTARQNARIVSLDDGSSVLAWEDERNGKYNIYAQRLDAKGAKLWGEGGIGVCTAGGNQISPQMISVGTSVIVTWQDHRGDYSNIYTQKIDSHGNIVWDKNGVAVCKVPANQMAPELASDGKGGAIITWYDYRSKLGEDIYAQNINAAGSPEWQTDGVPVCTENGTQWFPKILSDGAGGAVICWNDKRGTDYDIYIQRLDPKGSSLWQVNGIPVCKYNENQELCQIASCDADSFVIVWQDYRNMDANIYAQKMNMDGRYLWKMDGVKVCDTRGNQERPQIAAGKDPVIFWTDFRKGSGNSDIFCQKMSATGTPEWDPHGVPICEAPGNQDNIRTVPDGTGGAVIVWEDNRSSGAGIFARRVKNDGSTAWAADGTVVCTEKNDAEFPQISTSNGNIVIAWQDKRNGGTDVLAQSLDMNGKTNWRNNGLEIVTGLGFVSHQKPRIKRIGEVEYIIVWEDGRNGYSNIYAQKIDNNGKSLWNAEGIRICGAEGDQYDPELIADGSGGAIIVWEDSRSANSSIYAQRLDKSGKKLWNEDGIRVCQYEGAAMSPKLASDTKNGVIIVWQGMKENENHYSVYAQRIDENGIVLWRPDGVSVKNALGSQMDPQVASDGKEGAFITWTEYGQNSVTPDIIAQNIDLNGNILWANDGVAVSKSPGSQKKPVIGSNDEIIIAWEDNGKGNYDIYAQKLGKDGMVSWQTDGMPVCCAPMSQVDPKLVLNDDGGATFVWEDYRNNNWNIYSQRLNLSGAQMWAENGVEVCTVPGTHYAPRLVKSGGSSAIIVWEDYRSNKEYDIFTQKISESGEALWEKDGIPICITDGGSRNPQLADDGKGGAVVVWTDFRNGSPDIYAQRINDTENK